MPRLYRGLPGRLASLCRFAHLRRAVLVLQRGWIGVMSLRLQSKHPSDFLVRIQHADGVTPALVAKLAAQSGVRLDGSARLCRLMAAEAWTEVALVLIEMALPAWRPVRLVFDDGEWCCALSRHWQLPDWLDEAVEARHALVPLALLGAAVQALQ